MTTNEAIRIVAEYDEQHYWAFIEGLDYFTNLNELHRVALEVMDVLKHKFNNTDEVEAYMKIDHVRGNIKLALLKHPVNSQYTDLLLAVARGIEFINQSKTA
jgi:hypothetical protein